MGAACCVGRAADAHEENQHLAHATATSISTATVKRRYCRCRPPVFFESLRRDFAGSLGLGLGFGGLWRVSITPAPLHSRTFASYIARLFL
eukprot:COSAG02_NODE_69_length_42323_cov_23.507850_36_plen_91_part_00